MFRSFSIIFVSILALSACRTGVPSSSLDDAPGTGEAQTVETVFVCQDSTAELLRTVGIGLNDGPGLALYVVEQNPRSGEGRLALLAQVAKTTTPEGDTFRNSQGTMKLVVAASGEQLRGELAILADGPGSLLLKGMACQKNGTLSFSF